MFGATNSKNKLILVMILLILLVGGGIIFVKYHLQKSDSVACTMEAKMCPDGSYVGRTGPNCEFSACPNSGTQTADGDITLGVGQTGKVGGLSVTFNSFVQDSRCPIDVVCIQAGAVNVNVTLSDSEHSITKNMPSDEVPYEFDGYKVSIVSIAPPRESKKDIPSGAYRITFHIVPPKTESRTSSVGQLTGTVTLSPTCPVERIPPDPSCAPKPYSTFVSISGVHNFFVQVHTDSEGVFRLSLIPGTYTVIVHQDTIFPRCETKDAVIVAGSTTTTDISCDTGIR